MNGILSRIVADLFERSKGGEDRFSRINRLRDEIKKVIESENSIFGRFRDLVESFREIIPDEKQRYHAAIKALSTTSKLSRQEIVRAVNGQLEELKILEKGLMPNLPSWRDELTVMAAKATEMKGEIAKLRERLLWLENEETRLLNERAAREKELELAEQAIGELFRDMGAEIIHIRNKVEEYTAESMPVQPVPPQHPATSDIPVRTRESGEQKSEVREPSVPQEPQYAERQKKCPMCVGRMIFYSNERIWRCFSCAYQESQEAEGGGEQKSGVREPSVQQEPLYTEWQKKCPMCGGRMDFYSTEKMWMCFSCAYESKEGAGQDKSEGKRGPASTPAPAPAPKPTMDQLPSPGVPAAYPPATESKASPQDSQPSAKKKTCPVCRKKMHWHQRENIWRCSFCDYERRI